MKKHVLCSPTPTYSSSYHAAQVKKNSAMITIRKDLFVPKSQLALSNTDSVPDRHNKSVQYENINPFHSAFESLSNRRTQIQSYNEHQQKEQEEYNRKPEESNKLCVIASVQGNYKEPVIGEDRSIPKALQPFCTNTITISESDESVSSEEELFKQKKFFQENYRIPYTAPEDEEILKYVLYGYNIEKTSSISLWRELEKRMTSRTHQSLKNRFLRNIKPHIFTKFRHMLNADDIKKINKKFPELKKIYKSGLAVKKEDCGQSAEMATTTKRIECQTVKTANMCASNIIRKNFAHNVEEKQVTSRGVNTVQKFYLNKYTNTEECKDINNCITMESESNIQTFTFSKVIPSFPTNSRIEFKFGLRNNDNAENNSQSLLSGSEEPVKVDVIVKVSSVGKNIELTHSDLHRDMAKKTINGRNVDQKRLKNKIFRKRNLKYQLEVNRDFSLSDLPRSRILKTKKIIKKLQYYSKKQIKSPKKSSKNIMEPSDSLQTLQARVLRSQKPMQEDTQISQSQSQSDSTNCSVDDESCFSQAMRDVCHMYQIPPDLQPRKNNLIMHSSPEKRESKSGNIRQETSSTIYAEQSPKLLDNMLKMVNESTYIDRIQSSSRSPSKKL